MNRSEIISFSKGLPGFEELKQYVLEEHNEVFSYLKSTEREEVSFVVVDPFPFFPEYEFQASEEALEEIEFVDGENLEIKCIVTLHSNVQKTTANLLAPLIINANKKQGKQIVLHDNGYTAKHLLWPNVIHTEGGDR
ncbi:hypothetical protein BK126_21205 [Paenibacillus sp. FSL H7-0326]|uniref:flagellar assembly protein FliW n=1 Tax=Paenibacillus sp. FSL H7-0326 TaxID=1921144 RepID=UPI00096C5B2C|nr:flagellar assembly protein FliW [Paenibacillus sp. FSL H7-0326]OMC66518.1 hypothetical protein BK126_21205 [Paenibacillus sp. FSL H7-0326]